ncbi:MAG: hypothetical protein ACM3ZE_00940, partial [Myxococcales bacterium]
MNRSTARGARLTPFLGRGPASRGRCSSDPCSDLDICLCGSRGMVIMTTGHRLSSRWGNIAAPEIVKETPG